jgi:hypothetical protein
VVLISGSRARVLAFAALALALALGGCGSRAPAVPDVDGVYRTSVAVGELAAGAGPAGNWGTWTLVIRRPRFALTRENANKCTWMYGTIAFAGDRTRLTVIDLGGDRLDPANKPADAYAFRWSRYRDILKLRPSTSASQGGFVGTAWRRIADSPSATQLSARCPPPPGVLSPTGAEHAVPSPGAKFSFEVDLQRSGAQSWRGPGTSDALGRATVTLAGPIGFRSASDHARMTFTAQEPAGRMHGCAIVVVGRRPHRRFLWGSVAGQVTGATGSLRRYVGLGFVVSGLTSIDAIDRMHGSVESDVGPSASAHAVPRDLC